MKSVFTSNIGQVFAEVVMDTLKDKGWRGKAWIAEDTAELVVQARISQEAAMDSGERDQWRAAVWPSHKIQRRRLMVGRHRWLTLRKTVIA